jgi:hypothetical protein
MAGERAIHIMIFILVLIGLGGISGFIIFTSTQDSLLRIAGTALCWGTILLAMYAIFRMLDWKWWE